MPSNIGRPGAPDQADQPIGDHFFFPSRPTPGAGGGCISRREGALHRGGVWSVTSTGILPVLLPPLGDENAGIRPAPFAVDDAELTRQIGMRLDKQRLEQSFVRLDLPL